LPAPRDDLLAHPMALASTGDQSNLLKADFQSHWAPDNNMPALLLNTTDDGIARRQPGGHAPLIAFSSAAIRFRMSSKVGGGSSNIIGAIFR